MGIELDEPNMSDRTLLVSVEDLINMAMGPAETILHILARQMRLLEQRVEIRVEDERERYPSPTRDKDKKERRHRDRAKRHREKGKSEERSTDRDKDRTKREKEKDERAASKERDNGEATASKEREKAEKGERDKDNKYAAKERHGEDSENTKAGREVAEERAASKERKKGDKYAPKEGGGEDRDKSKAEKGAAKLREKTDKATAKEPEKTEKEIEKARRDKSRDRRGRTPSDTSILITEKERTKEKVLVVEKGPTTRSDARREGIEVVTRSQFDLVEALVKDLQSRASPLPALALPDNEKLRNDLARGSASLTDAMQAMQVTARVRAAEQAISRMGDLLTQLAAAGALPKHFADQIDDVHFEAPEADTATMTSMGPTKSRGILPSHKSVAIQEGSAMKFGEASGHAMSASSRVSVASGTRSMMSRASMASRASSVAGLPGVTHPEMDDALRTLREDLMKNIQSMTIKATTIAENANFTVKDVSDKLIIAMGLNERISTLNGLVSDYAEQLSGFDTGLTTQMQSFNEQMGQMRGDLNGGLTQLQQVNNNAETAAVMELTERYETLATELDQTVHTHNALATFQRQLADELHSLVECVEMLREQKADRDEVLDGLRDKADNSRLTGLLTTLEFSAARSELDKRLEVCHDKFRRQENVWMTALKDLTGIAESKAEVTQLLSARDNAEQALRKLQLMQEKLALILGEPKAAMLTRALARGAVCGACQAPALMERLDAAAGAPPPLPALRPRPLGASAPVAPEPCVADWKPPEPPDDREHTCHRWCGGSHTLLAPVSHEQAPQMQVVLPPTKKFTGYGSDGRLYMMEEELQPCLECNQFSEKVLEEMSAEQGAGDQGERSMVE